MTDGDLPDPLSGFLRWRFPFPRSPASSGREFLPARGRMLKTGWSVGGFRANPWASYEFSSKSLRPVIRFSRRSSVLELILTGGQGASAMDSNTGSASSIALMACSTVFSS